MNNQTGGSTPRPGAYSLVVVSLLAVVYTFNMLDRQLLSILSEPIRKELNLSYTQVGMLTGLTFALFYTVFGIPLAWLADRTHRVRLIAAALTVWSLFSMSCGLASNFAMLALARIGVGVGEAGGSPPSYAVVSDYFPPRRRGTAMAIYSLGSPFGTALGSAAGAGIAAIYGWRAAFLAVGLPGVLLALIVLMVIREPRRGRLDAFAEGKTAHAASLPLPKAIAAFFANPVLVMTGLCSGLANFVAFGFANNSAAYLISNRHMSLTQVAIYYSAVVAVAGVGGTLGGGWLADRLGRRDRSAYALVPATGLAISAPFVLAFLWAPTWPVALAFMAVPIAMNLLFLAPCIAVVQNAVAPGQRGTAGSILLFLMNIIGMGGGPLFVGLVADHFKPAYGTAALGFGIAALVPWVVAAVIALLISARMMKRDANLAALLATAAPAPV